MDDVDFSDEFCRFIQQAIPSVDTAEILLFLHKTPDTAWTLDQIIEGLRASMDSGEGTRSVQTLQEQGLVAVTPDRRIQFQPRSAELGAMVRTLDLAYAQRPVTLIRIIYALRDKKIRSFADAFKFTKG